MSKGHVLAQQVALPPHSSRFPIGALVVTVSRVSPVAPKQASRSIADSKLSPRCI